MRVQVELVQHEFTLEKASSLRQQASRAVHDQRNRCDVASSPRERVSIIHITLHDRAIAPPVRKQR